MITAVRFSERGPAKRRRRGPKRARIDDGEGQVKNLAVHCPRQQSTLESQEQVRLGGVGELDGNRRFVVGSSHVVSMAYCTGDHGAEGPIESLVR